MILMPYLDFLFGGDQKLIIKFYFISILSFNIYLLKIQNILLFQFSLVTFI